MNRVTHLKANVSTFIDENYKLLKLLPIKAEK
jgi:hypothetical protein